MCQTIKDMLSLLCYTIPSDLFLNPTETCGQQNLPFLKSLTYRCLLLKSMYLILKSVDQCRSMYNYTPKSELNFPTNQLPTVPELHGESITLTSDWLHHNITFTRRFKMKTLLALVYSSPVVANWLQQSEMRTSLASSASYWEWPVTYLHHSFLFSGDFSGCLSPPPCFYLYI